MVVQQPGEAVEMDPPRRIVRCDVEPANEQVPPQFLGSLGDQLCSDSANTRSFRHEGVSVLALRESSPRRHLPSPGIGQAIGEQAGEPILLRAAIENRRSP